MADTDRRRASLARILRVDYESFILVPFAALLWALCLAGYALSFVDQSAPEFALLRLLPRMFVNIRFHLALAIALVTTVTPYVIWRVLRIRRVIDTGQIVVGQIWEVNRERNQGSLVVRYQLDGETYERSQSLRFDERSSDLAVGDEVELAVDPAAPDGGLIRSLFIASG